MCIVIGLAAIWHALGDGLLVEHALMSASHHVQNVCAGALIDIFGY